MTAPAIVRELLNRFENNRESYRSGKYNETRLRREFLDPFFEALGWDVFNKGGYADIYKDVIREDSLEIEGEHKAPDYASRIGGVRKFFVEAKKPAAKAEGLKSKKGTTAVDDAFLAKIESDDLPHGDDIGVVP